MSSATVFNRRMWEARVTDTSSQGLPDAHSDQTENSIEAYKKAYKKMNQIQFDFTDILNTITT